MKQPSDIGVSDPPRVKKPKLAVIIDGRIVADGKRYRPNIVDPVGSQVLRDAANARSIKPHIDKVKLSEDYSLTVSFRCPYCSQRHTTAAQSSTVAGCLMLAREAFEQVHCNCGAQYTMEDRRIHQTNQ